MKKINIIILLIALNFSVSCDSNGSRNTNFYDLKIVFNKNLNKSKVDKAIPNNLLAFLNYTKIEDESQECFGKYYVPRITFYRADLNKEDKVDFPIAEMPFKMETIITPEELNNNYDVNRIKTPKLLTIVSEKNIVIENDIDENTFVLNIYKDSKENINALKSKITKALCSGVSNIKIIIKDEKVIEKPINTGDEGGNDIGSTNIGTGKEITTNPCQTTTISSGLELKEKLVEIIDTKRSTTERIHLAEKVWNKYFDNDAYVAKYLHEGDKNSEIWEPGEGKEYFTSRLATLKSIYDINIIRIEYSKEDLNKITGIHIIECHNASQKI